MSIPKHHQIIWAEPFFPDPPQRRDPLWTNEQRAWSDALVEHVLAATSQPGDLVLDPFAGQASLARAAHGSRRRVVLSHSSPAMLLSVLASASPPASGLLDTAFSRIADAPRRGRTLVHHLQALYETVCPECAQTIPAAYFIWDRTTGEPVAKGITCTHCQANGQVPADMADLTLVSSLEVRGAAYWGLLSRLVAPGDPLTAQARSLLEIYPPRGLLAFSELLTAAEQRLAAGDEQRAAKTMILSALERCTALHEAASLGHTYVQPTPQRTLQPPARFVEHNVWAAFEYAYRTLRERSPRLMPLTQDLPSLRGPEGAGRVLPLNLAVPELAERLEPGSVALILTEPPRFDPPAYALSFLWTGWLFGRDAAGRLKTLLSTDQWSWDWYGRAMTTALRSLLRPLRSEGHLVLAFSDRSSRRAIALLAAAEAAGWRLSAQAAQASLLPEPEEPAWLLTFQPDDRTSAHTVSARLAGSLQHHAQEAAFELVEARAEPTPAVLVNTACGIRWAETGLLRSLGQHLDAARRPVSFLVEQARLALTPEMPPPGLQALAWPDSVQPAPHFWDLEQAPPLPPLADRVEQRIVQLLEAGEQPASQLEIDLYATFPGLVTPDAALVSACIASYALVDNGIVRLRDEDAAVRRARDLGEMLLRLHELGHRFGFDVWVASWEQEAAAGLVPVGRNGPDQPQDWAPASLVWQQNGQPTFAFAVSLQALVHPWLSTPPEALASCPRCVVLPGGRAELLDFKLRRCPWWRERLAWAGWDFVKFRYVRELAALPDLTLAGFRARIGLDPIVALPGQQLTLFEDTRKQA